MFKKIRNAKIRNASCICLSALMVSTFVAGNVLAFADDKTGAGVASTTYSNVAFEDVTGKINLQSIALGNLNSSVMQSDGSASYSSMVSGTHTFIVELDADCILDSAPAGMPVTEYVATSAGTKSLKSIESSQRSFLSQLSGKGIGYTYVNGYNTVTNAVAIKTDSANIDKIKTINGVKSVVYSSTYAYPQTVDEEVSGSTINPSNVYATGIYKSEEYVEKGIDGRGMVVAVLDTGLDYSHPAFSHDPVDGGTLTKEAVRNLLDSKDFAAEATNATVNDVYVSAKVPFAYDYADKDADVYPSYSQHGTHVAGIIGGKDESYTNKDGETAKDDDGNVLTFRGVAPEAQLVICKVFTDNLESSDLGGAVSEDIIAALEDCIKLNVDIINMSLGTSGGFSSISIDGDTEGQLMNDVYGRVRESGINLVCAASNEYSSGFGGAYGTNLASNPDSGTVGSPSTFAGALSVASINGQLSRYMTVEVDGVAKPIYYDDSSNVNMKLYDFNEQMLSGAQTKTFKYVMIPGYGANGDYTAAAAQFGGNEPVIAVVQRGDNTFEDKVGIAMRNGASAIIVYNNVAGTIRMNLGDMENPIPSVSVSLDAGELLRKAAVNGVGYITLNESFQEGPFMNDYSSWGSTPDLKLKPDITAHGGEITSTVAGGYDEMSGTSMASPNMAGFAALVTSYIKNSSDINITPDKYTEFTNQLIMSTATTVYDREGLPYSPRKQGAGLATLDNVFTTSAYLFNDEEENKRPKIELGADMIEAGSNKGNGVYNMTFKVANFGADVLTFKTQATFFTEELTSNGVAVAEKAHLFSDTGVWTVNGKSLANGQSFEVRKGETATVSVTLTLTTAEKNYIETSFKNGMFVEGFLKLISQTDGQCDLTCPFMGFYGDWNMAPMLDMDIYQKTEYDKDSTYTSVTRPQPQVWATQPYASYYNDRYVVPLGSYVYVQDESKDQIYFDADHMAISRYNEYTDDESYSNYMTTTGLKSLYTGLLRNAEIVTYRVTNADTGEVIYDENGNEYREIYRISKAFSGGGAATPANVKLEWTPDDLGLKANGKYSIDFHFYRTVADKETEDNMTEAEKAVYASGNTFEMTFYVDYEAPVLVQSRIKYRTSGTGTNAVQTATLELDVYDNHYPEAIMLCYAASDGATSEVPVIQLATDYITPVYNAKKNDITTVTIDVTEILKNDLYKNSLYVQVCDYALNYTIYTLDFETSNQAYTTSDFEIAENSRITLDSRGNKQLTLGLNEAFTVSLTNIGDADLSNFKWETGNPDIAQVRNGQIFATGVGETTITVAGNSARKYLTVKVEQAENTVRLNSISFGVIKNSNKALQAATGTVTVNAGQNFELSVICNPWYYPVQNLKLKWTSNDENIVSVDQNGNVTTHDEKGTAFIKAVVLNANGTESSISATVTLRVLDPFTISSTTLTEYNGSGGDIVIPDNENIMSIGEEAFKDNDNITSIVIPSTVTQIDKRAFKNCTALEAVYFISKEKQEIANADLTTILQNAFEGCTSLKLVDLSNVKTITVDKFAFRNCTSLEEVRAMENIGTMNIGAFANCTKLTQVDISGLHNSGAGTVTYDEYFCDVDDNGYITAFYPERSGVFYGCTSLQTVTTGKYTSISDYMFYGCTSLQSIEINCARVGNYAFANCTNLRSVTFGEQGGNLEFSIGAYAFNGCRNLNSVTFNGEKILSIGDMAFAGCESLSSLTLLNNDVVLGDSVFKGTNVTVAGTSSDGALYSGTTLVLAPKTITSGWSIKTGTTEIAPYAFSDSTLASGVTTITIPSTVTKIGEGAFAYLNLSTLVLPNIQEIPDYMLYGNESLTSIKIPASVKTIGISAFEGCGALRTVEFGENSVLATVSDSAFKNCYSLVSIELPEGPQVVKVDEVTFTGGAYMGDEVFYGCFSLQTVTLPSLTYLGTYTFFGCTSLTTVTFGKDSSVTGSYTFFPGEDALGTYHSSLTDVTIGDNVWFIGTGAFAACNSLVSIDLNNAVAVGAAAFSSCENLATVTGMENLQIIGDEAFMGCFALTSLNLTSARYIGDLAFCVILSDGTTNSSRYTSISIPNVESIGYLAFYGGGASIVSLPASLESLGAGAFATSRLNQISIAENDKFFVENNVLYRYITPDSYELVLYPSTLVNNVYTVKEGTVAIGDYAFSGLVKTDGNAPVTRVVLPYSLKIIGVNAFANSGITEYEFHSIAAPVLMNEYSDLASVYPLSLSNSRVNSMFYYNFDSRFIEFTGMVNSDLMAAGTTVSYLTMIYPSNGTGYTNFIYGNYFRYKTVGDEEFEEVTKALADAIEALVSPETVRGWASLEVKEENEQMVRDFAEQVKKAHELLNTVNQNIKDGVYNQTQLELLGDEALEKLSSVESELRTIKKLFNIPVTATALKLDASSTHKTSYVSGEKFDMNGLVLIVVYDDYSEELADMSLIKLSSGYDGALSSLDRYVQVEGYGVTLRVNVTVTQNQNQNNDTETDGGNCSGCATIGSSGSFDGGMLILIGAVGIMFAAMVVAKLKKRN